MSLGPLLVCLAVVAAPASAQEARRPTQRSSCPEGTPLWILEDPFGFSGPTELAVFADGRWCDRKGPLSGTVSPATLGELRRSYAKVVLGGRGPKCGLGDAARPMLRDPGRDDSGELVADQCQTPAPSIVRFASHLRQVTFEACGRNPLLLAERDSADPAGAGASGPSLELSAGGRVEHFDGRKTSVTCLNGEQLAPLVALAKDALKASAEPLTCATATRTWEVQLGGARRTWQWAPCAPAPPPALTRMFEVVHRISGKGLSPDGGPLDAATAQRLAREQWFPFELAVDGDWPKFFVEKSAREAALAESYRDEVRSPRALAPGSAEEARALRLLQEEFELVARRQEEAIIAEARRVIAALAGGDFEAVADTCVMYSSSAERRELTARYLNEHAAELRQLGKALEAVAARGAASLAFRRPSPETGMVGQVDVSFGKPLPRPKSAGRSAFPDRHTVELWWSGLVMPEANGPRFSRPQPGQAGEGSWRFYRVVAPYSREPRLLR